MSVMRFYKVLTGIENVFESSSSSAQKRDASRVFRYKWFFLIWYLPLWRTHHSAYIRLTPLHLISLYIYDLLKIVKNDRKHIETFKQTKKSDICIRALTFIAILKYLGSSKYFYFKIVFVTSVLKFSVFKAVTA